MISADDVYSIFLTLISPDSVKGTDKALSLCCSSLERITKLIRSDADMTDPRIPYVCACDAYYMYALSMMTDIEENADFKAGDLTVKRRIKETLEVAERIKKSSFEEIKELLKDNSFGVWSV
ncbi:MAG: hypothetical protein ACI4RU_00915 [Acutalibacteraceae bacterium]